MEGAKYHSDDCANAHAKRCRCWCNGRLHGIKSGMEARVGGKTVTFDQMFTVGEVVEISNPEEQAHGMLAWVDEVVTEPRPPFRQFQAGTFSLYGFEKNSFFGKSPDFYLGDFKGYELVSTGRHVTDEELAKIQSEDPENKGLAKDIEFVKTNRGKSTKRDDRLMVQNL